MKVIAITQARVGSSRLPAKVLKKIGDKTLLQIHLERAKQSKAIDELIVATTNEEGSEQICDIARNLGLNYYKGSVNDVLDRYYQAAVTERPDYVVRLTSDCPLIDPDLMDKVINTCIEGKYDYVSNGVIPTYPDGVDTDIFTFAALQQAWGNAILASDREHVTPYIYKNSSLKGGTLFKGFCVQNGTDYSKHRITIDEESDFVLVKTLVEALGTEKSWIEYIRYIETHPGLFDINSAITRNEGYTKSLKQDKIMLRNITNYAKSDAYRARIHDLIPGGAHTYSKGDDQFPQLAPAAITHGKGAHVWDLDGNKFLDCSMGLTSVSLGHAYEPVLDRIRKELEKGVNFQRPSYIEMEMAEKFLNVVGCHDMVKFGKNGSTVTTAAVKLARAYTGRKLVAFPAEHPFYSYDDWFIGTTACNSGVPEEFSKLSVTYKADNLASLKELFDQYPGQIACVLSEPEKNWGIPENYLQQAIDLAHANGALYIIDEIVTGYKTDFPGSMKKYNVVADIATWGKGIANGFSFCALSGKKEIMELGGIRKKGAEKVFLISSTHGAETHAVAAGLATIEEYESKNVIAHLHKIGDKLNELCQKVIDEHKLNDYISLAPCNWQPVFVFKGQDKQASLPYRTLALQEMIRRGVLFQGILVPSFSHTIEDIEYFAEAFNETAGVYKQALENGLDKYLIGEPTKPVFRKYL